MIARHYPLCILAVVCWTVVAFAVLSALSFLPRRASFLCPIQHEYERPFRATLYSRVFSLEKGLGLISHFPISGNIATATAPSVPHATFYSCDMQLSYLVTGSAPYGLEASLARSVPPHEHSPAAACIIPC